MGMIYENGTPIASLHVTGDTVPIGGMIPWTSNTIPDNWLLCDGQAVSRTTYASLFAVVSTTYGAGDGTTTFNVPNVKGRTIVGRDSADTDFDVLGETGGSKFLQSHTHTAQAGAKTNTWAAPNLVLNYQYQSTASTTVGAIDAFGSGNSENLQPFIVENYIIKAQQSSGVVATVVDNLTSTSATNALSANQGRLLKGIVREYTQTGSATSIVITGLDLAADGGCYQIEFVGASSGIGIIGLTPNGSGNICDFMRTDMIKTNDVGGAATIDSYYYKNSSIHLGRFNGASGGTTQAICWITKLGNGYPVFTSRSFARGADGQQIARNGEGWISTNTNITSLTFSAETGNLSACIIRISKI